MTILQRIFNIRGWRMPLGKRSRNPLFLLGLCLTAFSGVQAQYVCPGPPTNFGQCGSFTACPRTIVSTMGTELCASGFTTDLSLEVYEPTNSANCEGLKHTWYYEWRDPNNDIVLCGQGESRLNNVSVAGTYTCAVQCDNQSTLQTSTITLTQVNSFVNQANLTPDFLWRFQGAGNAVPGISGSSDGLAINPTIGNTPWPARYKAFVPGSEGSTINSCSDGAQVQYGAMSVEFWLKMDQYELTDCAMEIMSPSGGCGGLWSLVLGPDRLTFSGRNHSKSVWMNGIGRRSIQYYMDDAWHHFAMTLDAATGECKLYVDGQSPPEFQMHFTPLTTPKPYNVRSVVINFGINGVLDELAFYQFDALTAETIAKHYADQLPFNANGTYPTPSAYSDPCQMPAIDALVGDLHDHDFPVGLDPNDPNDTGAGIDLARNQVADAPGPRYQPGHDLKRLFPWLHGELYRTYGADWSDNTLTDLQKAEASAELMEEFADGWNYQLVLPAGDANKNQFHYDLANARPDLPLGYITLWKQANPENLNPALPGSSMITQQGLSDNHYIDCSATPRRFSPVAPRGFLRIDGLAIKKTLDDTYLPYLDRPIDLITENGEVQINVDNIPCFKEFMKLPATSPLKTDFDNFINPLAPAINDTISYYASTKTAWRQHYLAAIMDEDPRMQHSRATWYSVDGLGGHFAVGSYEVWPTVKQILDVDPDHTFRYSTPDIYPATPAHWWKGTGVSHGIDYFYNTRKHELADGALLSSPFVNAGYRGDLRDRIRPTQWLGFLKLMSVYGAENFYAGFFDSEQDSRFWIWQLMVPAYAQAITSRYEKVLDEGDVLKDVSQNYQFKIFHENHDPSVATGVRKYATTNANVHDKTYVIATTRQPFTNMVNPADPSNEPFQVLVNDLDQMGEHQFKSRKQGSVYIYQQDATLEPIFYQLDGWHEEGHPNRWARDFVFEAEVYDDLEQNGTMANLDSMGRRTRIITSTGEAVPAKNAANDFSDFVTYMSCVNVTPSSSNVPAFTLAEGPTLSYQFRVNASVPNSSFDYSLHLRARALPGSATSTGLFYELVHLESGAVLQTDRVGCIGDNGWNWYTQGSCGAIVFDGLKVGNYALRITPENGLLELDQIILDEMSTPLTWGTPIACSEVATPTVHFTWEIDCDGTVKFINHSLPFGDCSNSPTFRWDFEYSNPNNVMEGSGQITGVANASGTYENPVYQYTGPGPYTVKVAMNLGNGTYAYDGLHTINIPSPPALTNNTSLPVAVCEGADATLSINATGTAPLTYSWFPSIAAQTPHAHTTVITPSESDTYTITVTDGNGCQTVKSYPVTVNPHALALDLQADLTLELSDLGNPNSAFTATGSGGNGHYDYHWSPVDILKTPWACNNNASSCNALQQSGQDWGETHLGPTLITVEMVEQGTGCTTSSSILLDVINDPTPKAMGAAAATAPASELVEYYPNPTQGTVNIWQNMGAVQVELTDLHGHLISRTATSEAGFQLDLANYPAGIYMVHIFNQKEHVHLRIVHAGQ